jgi:hypothetical protein
MPHRLTHHSEKLVDFWRARIAEALRRGSITVAEENMGYVLYKKAVTAGYAPDPDSEPTREPLSPELLTGHLTNSRI